MSDLWFIGGIISAGFYLGLSRDDKDFLELLIGMGFSFLISWIGVIGLIITVKKKMR